ncbi:hypothetical protein [Burkholderia ubonensis]|uniref:Fatty acid desaturase n=1 Tax=Burkholderia ubonensis TaxID=101571 RepID=A0A107FCD4_9BURK|nr:hypothetical protein [Burkholderia ubonensis]KWD84933.1 hypothetical protein WL70_00735 [Burkholderia ubonensis]KWD90791.1 hypothetical protein WL71_06920 [Burkholderia ubonensis]KWE00705.1 hypothetical protein WL72_12175 [Burkholderia ubonensis]KWE05779.1 hypothetical protein WL73_11435 [Burkholderia ubonensis]MDY7789017.1 hypothetical protein [Burkholderia ubonensis]
MSQRARITFRNDAEKVAYVRREVNAASDAIRARFPLLDHQNLVGAGVMAASVAAQPVQDAAERARLRIEQGSSYLPVGHLYYALWHAFIVYHAGLFALGAFGYAVAVPPFVERAMHVVDFLAVVWLGPNFVRSFCINFVSSNLHYCGDIDSRNVIQQTQVLNPWWMLPFQLFCFNFGSTHAIHHFVVRDPFYIRQLTAKTAHAALREAGVRFNDVGTFARANRWGSYRPARGAQADL